MFCHQCGKSVLAGANYCSSCGTPIDASLPNSASPKLERPSKPSTDILPMLRERLKKLSAWVTLAPSDSDLPKISREELERPLKGLTWSFAGALSGFLLLMFLGAAVDKKSPLFIVAGPVSLLSFFLGALLFYVFLGILAARLNRSVIVWVGVTFMTVPIGPFVAYSNIRGLVKKALVQANTSPGKLV